MKSDAIPNEDANTKSDRSKNIVSGLGSLTVQNLATSGLGFLFLAILLRLLPTVQYGIYSAVIVATGIASSISNFGLNQTMARYVALLRDTDERASWLAARKILTLSLVLTTICTTAYSLLCPYLSVYFGKTTQWTGVFLLGGVFLFLIPLSNVCQGIVQGCKRYVLLAKITFLARLATVIFSIAALLLFRSVYVAILAWILFTTLIVVWVLAITYREIASASGKLEYSRILNYAYPLGIAGVITIIASTSDQVVVGGYLNAVSLGVYSAAVTLSGVLSQVLAVPLTTALLPEFSSLGGVDGISNGSRLALRFISLIVLPASLLVASVSGQLIGLFSGGGGYLGGSSSLELIAAFYVFTAIQLAFLSLFQAIGRTGLVLFIGVLTAAVDIGAALILVPSLGLIGAALTKALVGITGAFLALYLSREYLKKVDDAKFYLKCVIASIIPFAVTLVFSFYFSQGLMTLIPCAIIYLVVFLVLLKFLRLLSDEDRSYFMHIAPSFMKRVIESL